MCPPLSIILFGGKWSNCAVFSRQVNLCTTNMGLTGPYQMVLSVASLDSDHGQPTVDTYVQHARAVNKGPKSADPDSRSVVKASDAGSCAKPATLRVGST
jgi:hypothetical protein